MLMGTGRAGGRGGADTFAVIVSTLQRVDAGGSGRRGGNNRRRKAHREALLALRLCTKSQTKAETKLDAM